MPPSTKMASTTNAFFFISFFVFLSLVTAGPPVSRSAKTLRLPFLGPRCEGCPPNFCDDDPAVVQGYCCGCARFFDVLPVTCGAFLHCPLNSYDLCEDYEYMMHCCC